MRNALLLAAGALALSTAAQADAIVRQESQTGVYSAPVAGATPSALAAAVRLPRVATETKDSSCFNLSMATDYEHGS